MRRWVKRFWLRLTEVGRDPDVCAELGHTPLWHNYWGP